MTFPREYPFGVPVNQVISSTNFTNWDVRISQSVDGVGGGTYGGAIVLTNTVLGGSSSVVTTGDVECRNLLVDDTLSVTNTAGFQGAADFTAGIDVQGTAAFHNAVTVAIGGELDAHYVLADKVQSLSIDERSIDCVGGAVSVALDLSLHDHFLLHLSDSSGADATAVLHAITFAFSSGNAAAAPKKGSKYYVMLDANPAQAGGMGLDFAPWPVTVTGYTKADCLGPRTGDISGVGGGNDFMLWMLECTAIAGGPVYSFRATLLAMGGGL